MIDNSDLLIMDVHELISLWRSYAYVLEHCVSMHDVYRHMAIEDELVRRGMPEGTVLYASGITKQRAKQHEHMYHMHRMTPFARLQWAWFRLYTNYVQRGYAMRKAKVIY
jgi:hypothetical protein